MGTAGFARSAVSGHRRRPSPPARTTERTCSAGPRMANRRLGLILFVVGPARAATRARAADPTGSAHGTVEVDFPSGYPAGRSVVVTVAALDAGAVVGSGSAQTTLTAACATLAVDVVGDAGAGVAEPDAGGNSDGGACVPLTSCPATAAC